MSFIEIKLIKLKNVHKYFVFHISNKNPKKITNDVDLLSKNNFKFLNNNFNCIIIIYKLCILIF